MVYKVGDKVRALDSVNGEFTRGKIYTVKRVGEFSLSTEEDDSGRTDNGWTSSNFELVPTFTISAGKFYRTRDGRKVGPMESDDWGDGYPWTDGERWYSGNGAWIESEESEHDLIAEWHDTPSSPVATQVDAIAEEYGPAPAEPDTTLHIKFTSDFSELDAAILVRKKEIKKLIKLSRKAGIDLRGAA